MVEVSDYHCPFCRRHTLTTQPQIDAEYINTGKLRYVFIDYPIDQLHPEAFKAHEAANCAGDQGKYWEMHVKLFEQPPPRDSAQLVPLLVSQAQAVGLDAAKFRSCFESGKYATPVKDNVARMQALGVDSTPTFLIGMTPAPGQPMKVVRGRPRRRPPHSSRADGSQKPRSKRSAVSSSELKSCSESERIRSPRESSQAEMASR